jgi:fructose-specific component phosphotransferase system IIB-like protein
MICLHTSSSSVQQKVRFYFGPCWSNIISTLNEAEFVLIFSRMTHNMKNFFGRSCSNITSTLNETELKLSSIFSGMAHNMKNLYIMRSVTVTLNIFRHVNI